MLITVKLLISDKKGLQYSRLIWLRISVRVFKIELIVSEITSRKLTLLLVPNNSNFQIVLLNLNFVIPTTYHSYTKQTFTCLVCFIVIAYSARITICYIN